eukprot:403372061
MKTLKKLQEPQTYDETASFATKIFFIRYAEEIVNIRDIVKFRTEIDVQPGYLNTEFFLKCELYYCPPPQNNFSAAIGSAEIMKEELSKSTAKFTLAQTKIYQINGLLQGMSTFVPIQFDKEYTSQCVSTFHGSIIDYRFRVKNQRIKLRTNGDTFMENGILVEAKFEDLQEYLLQTEKQNQQPITLADYFFQDEYGILVINDRKISERYFEYASTLKQIYHNLKATYLNFSQKAIYQDDLIYIDFPRVPKDLEILGLDQFLDKEITNKRQVLAEQMQHISINDARIDDQDQSTAFMEEESKSNGNILSSLDEERAGAGGGDSTDSPNVRIELNEDEESKVSTQEIPKIQVSLGQNKSKAIEKVDTSEIKNLTPYSKLSSQQKDIRNDPHKVSNAIVMEINYIAGQLFELSNNLAKLIIYRPKRIYKILSEQYQKQLEERYGENILRHVIKTSDFSIPSEDYTGQLNDTVAKKTREVLKLHKEMAGVEPLTVEEVKIIEEEVQNGKKKTKKRKKRNMEKYAPLIFEECYVKIDKTMFNKVKNTFEMSDQDIDNKVNPSKAFENYKGIHLFVLCHGFQGSSFDMRMFKNVISIALSEAQFLCSTANEQDTDGNILDMGYKLSQEVHQYVRESCPGHNLSRLTFIGHSLGGLIIRAALPYLEKYKDKMHGFLTLCTPHLGYMYKSGKMFNAGMWVLKKWRKSQCLTQLSMADSKYLEKTAIFELSEAVGFEWFKHIIFVSSFQDQYAPFDSARIQICQDAAKDVAKGNTYIKMANNLLSKLPIDVLYRLDVNFNISETNLDSIIGRTAHILFLENEELMKMMVSRYKSFFS